MNVKKLMTFALSAVMVLSLAACGQSAPQPHPAKTDAESNVQIPNPFADCETLEEAIDITGFDMAVPETLEGYDQPTFQVMSGTMIQVIYRNDKEESVFIRKAPGSDDISGDYNAYSAVEEISAGKVTATLKGLGDSFTLAIWSDGVFSYSLQLSGGLTAAEWETLIAAVH